jgi:small subunit ribosomal protein S16
MAVKIRFSRLGAKNNPCYRVVAIDERSARDGKFIEDLGTYNPVSHSTVQWHAERIEYWINHGAVMSDAVHKLYKQHQKLEKKA